MSEQAEVRLIALIAVMAVVGCWLLARTFASRRKQRFLAIAHALGGQPEMVNDYLISFQATVGGRVFEVRCQHIGGGGQEGSGWTPDWYLVTSTQLRGVSELHSADIRPRSRPSAAARVPTAEDFVVRDAGYPLRNGWFTPDVARSLQAFYLAKLPLEPLSIEEGCLVHRSRPLLSRFDAAGLRSFLERQAVVAAALERVL
ncbi:MAG: hypothetical protein JNN30_16515 [Rhodanobacteraceae bacterium]|nr:hypothetical protein [Rhodanobacteraceae bacterium]